MTGRPRAANVALSNDGAANGAGTVGWIWPSVEGSTDYYESEILDVPEDQSMRQALAGTGMRGCSIPIAQSASQCNLCSGMQVGMQDILSKMYSKSQHFLNLFVAVSSQQHPSEMERL